MGVMIADVYEITTLLPYTDKPHEFKTYTLPPQALDGFFHEYGGTGEIIVDIRPVESQNN